MTRRVSSTEYNTAFAKYWKNGGQGGRSAINSRTVNEYKRA